MYQLNHCFGTTHTHTHTHTHTKHNTCTRDKCVGPHLLFTFTLSVIISTQPVSTLPARHCVCVCIFIMPFTHGFSLISFSSSESLSHCVYAYNHFERHNLFVSIYYIIVVAQFLLTVVRNWTFHWNLPFLSKNIACPPTHMALHIFITHMHTHTPLQVQNKNLKIPRVSRSMRSLPTHTHTHT